jgi:cation:H+ antiporter
MALIEYSLIFIFALIMVVKGSDWFLDSIIWVASVFRIPYIIIGATVVSIFTTIPETFYSVTAALKGETDLAFGSSVGSIAVNTGIILSILIILAKPVLENKKEFIKNGIFLIIVLIITLLSGIIYLEISRIVGAFLVLLLILFIYRNFLSAKATMDLDIRYDLEPEENIDREHPLFDGVSFNEDNNEIDISKNTVFRKLGFFLLGVFLVVSGSILLVDNGIKIAQIFNVPSILIAIIFTSIGTSLPEIITMISSIRKGVSSLGVGNIIGANTLNIVQVIGLSSLIRPIDLAHDKSMIYLQLPAVLFMVTLAILFGAFNKSQFKRWQGFVILATYIIFLTFNLLRENTPFLGPIFF